MTELKPRTKTRIVTEEELDAFDLDSVDWARIDATTDEEIDAQIAVDPDVAPIADDDFFARAALVLPEPKTPISLRVDSDVLRGFRKAGAGYQARMNEALRHYAVEHGWIGEKPDRPVARRGRPAKHAK
jgi:uncharacterized protein (DUF4415 family)